MSEENNEYDCEKHETDYPTGYNHCPLCRREQDAHAREMEMLERRADPDMHNSVDARRR